MAQDTRFTTKKHTRRAFRREGYASAVGDTPTEQEFYGGDITAGAAWEVTIDRMEGAQRRIRLEADGSTEIDITNANEYASQEIFTFPDRNLRVNFIETDLELTKDGTGYATTTDIYAALGSAAAAANSSFTDAQADFIDEQSFTATDASPAMDVTSFANVDKGARLVEDGSATKMYFNVRGATERMV